MTELQQLIAMLERAFIGHGTRHDSNPDRKAVLVESERDDDDKWWVTEFGFDEEGSLAEVVTYEGEEG